MADREKTIRGLECCTAFDSKGFPLCEECPYADDGTCHELDQLHRDALSLLKKQEPVEPERAHSGGGSTWWNVCGNCKTAINPNDKFCHECGRAVKWNG